MSDMAELTVTVDRDACCGVGRCAMTAPEVFAQRDADGTVELLESQPPPRLHEDVLLCAELCPCSAISVHRS
ncbi:Ferredoxin [Saccharomonospora viridis]|nr:Ferredoxin [Saccharomonospora viridis]